MKTTLIIMAVSVSILSASCAKRCTNKDVIGMVHHSQTLIDQELITVMEYKEFIYAQMDADRTKYLPVEPNALAHFQDISTLNLPVIGLSLDQAMAYCHWRSDMWNAKEDGKEYLFRLPTQNELEGAIVDPLTDIRWREALADAEQYTEMQRVPGEISVGQNGVVAYVYHERCLNTAVDLTSAEFGFRCVAEVEL